MLDLFLNPNMYRNEKNNFYQYLKIQSFLVYSLHDVARERKPSDISLKSCLLAGFMLQTHFVYSDATPSCELCVRVCVCVCAACLFFFRLRQT